MWWSSRSIAGGLAKALIGAIVEDAELASMRKMLLGTVDAHSLYTRFGFKPEGDRFMELLGSTDPLPDC